MRSCISHRRTMGLGNISGNGFWNSLWTLVPALIMVTVAVLFACVDFIIRCLTPYAALRHAKGAALDQSLAYHFVATISVLNIFRSIRLKSWTVLATTLSALLAPFLTIAASSLYSAVYVPRVTAVELLQQTLFAEHMDPSSYEDNDGLTAGLIIHNNPTFTDWTYDKPAFPELKVKDSPDTQGFLGGFADIKVPPLRAGLTCRTRTGAELQVQSGKQADMGKETRSDRYLLEVNGALETCDGLEVY